MEQRLSDPIYFEKHGERHQATFLFSSRLWYFHNLDKGAYLFSQYDLDESIDVEMLFTKKRAIEMFEHGLKDTRNQIKTFI